MLRMLRSWQSIWMWTSGGLTFSVCKGRKLFLLDYSPKPLDVQQEKHNLDLPKDVSTRYGYIVVEVSRSSLSFGSGLDVELSSGVKVVELP